MMDTHVIPHGGIPVNSILMIVAAAAPEANAVNPYLGNENHQPPD
jgi:hypothetical protein